MIYTHLGATPAHTVLTDNAIELLPNLGFSLQGVLDLLCTVWKPSGSLKALKTSLCWAKDNLMKAEGRRKLCEILTHKAQDILNALAETAAQKMLQWADVAGIGAHCAICGSGGVDVGKLLADIAKAVLSAIGSDGISYGTLAKNLGLGALAEAACCAVIQGLKAVQKKLPINRAFDGLRTQCARLLAASGDKEVPGLSTAITFDFGDSSSGGSQVPPSTTHQQDIVREARRKISQADTSEKSGVSWPWPLILTATFTGGASWWIWRRRGRR